MASAGVQLNFKVPSDEEMKLIYGGGGRFQRIVDRIPRLIRLTPVILDSSLATPFLLDPSLVIVAHGEPPFGSRSAD